MKVEQSVPGSSKAVNVKMTTATETTTTTASVVSDD